ncbi:hypothetical protein IGI04_037632 [Brassica rapa subsp. trilocularis]|uniref:Uncharacterized protein n=1 Tax=Brassica rapa subsp. trilocularis TaxID=1813537 RepID=A0ABQ7LHW9_BRACM|nr:hypothetical protein IGI04_037632 [Brassica rapa subsp. trilocularis]
MHSSHLLLEEPIRMASILKPSKSVSDPLIHIQFLSGSFGNKIQLKVPCLHVFLDKVLTVTQEAFWKLGKRLLSSLNDLMGIPVIQNSYSPLMELAKQYEEEQESASATKKLHQKRQFITI